MIGRAADAIGAQKENVHLQAGQEGLAGSESGGFAHIRHALNETCVPRVDIRDGKLQFLNRRME